MVHERRYLITYSLGKLCNFVDAVFPTLIKQTILPIIQKAMPIILTIIFS